MIQINSIYHDIQLSFGTSDVKRTTIKQNSEDTHVLRIKLYDKQNNEITIDSNWNINISAIKGDKTHILNTNNISVKDNTVYVTMTKQMLSASGTERCELIIQDGDQTLFSDTFLIYVEPNVQDGSFIESSSECDSIIQSLDKVKGYEQEALNVKDHIVSVSNDVDNLKKDIEETYDELENAINTVTTATSASQQATTKCEEITLQAESALQNQDQLNKTLISVTKIEQNVQNIEQNVMEMQEQVSVDKEEINTTIKNSLLESSEDILNSVKDYYNRAQELYNSMYIDCDGETPQQRAVTIVSIDCGTPQSRLHDDNGILFNGGTPINRQLAS